MSEVAEPPKSEAYQEGVRAAKRAKLENEIANLSRIIVAIEGGEQMRIQFGATRPIKLFKHAECEEALIRNRMRDMAVEQRQLAMEELAELDPEPLLVEGEGVDKGSCT